jgi:hypothetical protein
MSTEMTAVPNAAAAGTITIGGDLTVNRLGFGAMRVTGRGIWGEPRDLDEARAVLRRVVEGGVTFIDTADSYGPYVSEQLIGEALYPYPENLVIATKGGLERPGPDVWTNNGTPAHLRTACEGSLKRLRLEQIPLYQWHRPDPDVPLEDSVGTLADLQREGKIRHIGRDQPCHTVSRLSAEPVTRRRGRGELRRARHRDDADHAGHSEGVGGRRESLARVAVPADLRVDLRLAHPGSFGRVA